MLAINEMSNGPLRVQPRQWYEFTEKNVIHLLLYAVVNATVGIQRAHLGVFEFQLPLPVLGVQLGLSLRGASVVFPVDTPAPLEPIVKCLDIGIDQCREMILGIL